MPDIRTTATLVFQSNKERQPQLSDPIFNMNVLQRRNPTN